MYNSSLTSTNKITSRRNKAERVLTRKTSVSETLSSDIENLCPIHRSNHSLEHCRAFRAKPLDQRRKILKDNNMCFKCLSKTHKQHECTSDVKCAECGSSCHSTPLHVKRKPVSVNSVVSMRPDGGEDTGYRNRENVNSKCTQICGDPFNFKGKSCAKTVLVDVYSKNCPQKQIKVYTVIDDQSNKTLASSELFDMMGINTIVTNYVLASCAGRKQTYGRKTDNLVIESIDGHIAIELPSVIECEQIPNARDEIPTPEIALHYEHLRGIANYIPPIDNKAEIMMLIGRDITIAHHVLDQKVLPGNLPYAQKLHLGWTIIGETCLGKVHQPNVINTMKT